jgi:hypothetical protein
MCSAGDRLAVEVEHPAADQRRHANRVAMRDVAARRQIGRAEPVERPEHRRFGGAFRFAVADQIDHHRNAERIREQDEFLPLVAAHLAGFGEDFDRLKPFGLGQLDLLDEGVQVFDEPQHDLAQTRIGRRREARQHGRGDVVLGGTVPRVVVPFGHRRLPC